MKLIFKARLGENGPIQIVGSYELCQAEIDEYISDGDIEDFLDNVGSDWAYEAVHTDCLDYWAEVEKE